MNTQRCPGCGAKLIAEFLECSFVCPGCEGRVPAIVMWGMSDALDDRILRTDADFQAMRRGWDETETLSDYE